jgi:3-oxoacyl-[acyl-carrier-protein] synthase II
VDELSEFLFRGFSELHLLATDSGQGETSCPYDKRRNGLVLGEGAGLLVLEREEHARSRGARIYGYILGYGSVGRSSREDPSEDVGRSIKITLEGWKGTSIDYLSGAGNSSEGVDALEAKGVKKISMPQLHRVPVSSIKSMTGEAIASGGMRMVANVLSMENGFIPPTIHYLSPDPACDLDYVVNQKLDREIKTVLHLGISPENCFSSLLIGVEWNG